MLLKKLSLRNFKGIKDLTIDFGKVTDISGDNGKGKTSIFDAFTWLLFDKDSIDRKQFGIKTYDEENNVIHGLEHEVEGVLDLEPGEIKLRKVYKEKWTKKRGESEKTLTGHTTNYWIDDVPVKKKDYVEKIGELLDENIFKLITNPHYFNKNLHWEERRKLLIEVVGYVSDEDVIDSTVKLQQLNEILDGKSIDDYKKIINEQKKRYNKEIEQIPIRVDEINNNIPELEDNVDYTALEAEKVFNHNKLSEIEESINDVFKQRQSYNNKLKASNDKNKELSQIESKVEREAYKELNDNKLKLNRLQDENKSLHSNISFYEDKVTKIKLENEKLDKEMSDLRNKWNEVNAEQFKEPNREDFKCTTCGQQLPEDDVEAKINELKKNFNEDKLQRLDQISDKGKSFKSKKESNEKEIASINQSIDKFKATIKENKTKIEELEKLVEGIEIKVDFESNKEWIKCKKELEELEKQLEIQSSFDTKELNEKKNSILGGIEEINKILNNKEQLEKAKIRIEELKEKERELAEKINELEKAEFLIEEFTVRKVDMLESKINEKFKFARFKLFNRLVNGAIEPCCEIVINGVPYKDLNNAAKINAGLDVIDTLTEHYGVTAPIFIDNREAVNRIVDIESQVINLIVSKDEELTINYEESKVEVA